jgi:NAD(P)-dependent dehydrogenase (short-subunit alcohol dehydrogenase family)
MKLCDSETNLAPGLQVNNAGVSFNEIETNSVEHAETVLRTNFFGAKMLIEALLPLFRRSSGTSQILNLSSQLGLLNVSGQTNIASLQVNYVYLTLPLTLQSSHSSTLVVSYVSCDHVNGLRMGNSADETGPAILNHLSPTFLTDSYIQ